ncbi:hypothetical protein BGX38DRAFT_1139262 [Terfezia claveryi]|nr:hypothetical protein BGX38DRAFT_1139262 [Terfezia claveryi]
MYLLEMSRDDMMDAYMGSLSVNPYIVLFNTLHGLRLWALVIVETQQVQYHRVGVIPNADLSPNPSERTKSRPLMQQLVKELIPVIAGNIVHIPSTTFSVWYSYGRSLNVITEYSLNDETNRPSSMKYAESWEEKEKQKENNRTQMINPQPDLATPVAAN